MKERLVGAAVLVAIAVWLIPWVLDGPEGVLETNGSTLQLPTAEEPMPMRTQTLQLGDAPSRKPGLGARSRRRRHRPSCAGWPRSRAPTARRARDASRGRKPIATSRRRLRSGRRAEPAAVDTRRPSPRPRPAAAVDGGLDGAARQFQRGSQCAAAWRNGRERSATRPRCRDTEARADAVSRAVGPSADPGRRRSGRFGAEGSRGHRRSRGGCALSG